MKTGLWVCAILALAGTLEQAAGIRHILDTSQASPSISDASSLAALEQITNPKPGILTYPNAPGYPPDQAPDPAFMDLPNYAPGPGVAWADSIVDSTVQEMDQAPAGLPLAPDEAWVGAWEYVRDNSTVPAAAPENAAVASSPSPGAVSAYSLNG